MADNGENIPNPSRAPVIAIIGRSNTGKSTLFNRLIGQRRAIVASEAGVTRDYNEASVKLWGHELYFIDTGGVEERQTSRFSKRLKNVVTSLLPRVDLALFCIDGREGVVEEDRYLGNWLRKQHVPYFLVVNKIEGQAARLAAYSAYELGMGDPIMVSAEHGEGVGDLCEAIINFFSKRFQALQKEPDMARDASQGEILRPIKVAIAGRPNTGKSTLLNTLIGQDRLLTGDEVGVTRDSITIDVVEKGQKYAFVDTAGLRKKSKIDDYVEKRSVGSTLYAIKMAEIVILVIDADVGLMEQDLQIARLVEEEGRGCLLILNKWDRVEHPQKTKEDILDRLFTSFAQMRGMPVMLMSAIEKKMVVKIFPQLQTIYEAWNRRIPTSELNQWFSKAIAVTRPPLVKGNLIKLRYVTQVKTRPPTFAIFGTRLEHLPRSYMRYLANDLKDSFSLHATPVRFFARSRTNPYQKNSRKKR